MPSRPDLSKRVPGAPTDPGPSWGPQRIVCLTEETTEWLYLLGEEARIVGISGFTVRPARARKEKPRVSAFTSAKVDEITRLSPDLVVGFSRRARAGRTVKPEMPTMRASSPSAYRTSVGSSVRQTMRLGYMALSGSRRRPCARALFPRAR